VLRARWWRSEVFNFLRGIGLFLFLCLSFGPRLGLLGFAFGLFLLSLLSLGLDLLATLDSQVDLCIERGCLLLDYRLVLFGIDRVLPLQEPLVGVVCRQVEG